MNLSHSLEAFEQLWSLQVVSGEARSLQRVDVTELLKQKAAYWQRNGGLGRGIYVIRWLRPDPLDLRGRWFYVGQSCECSVRICSHYGGMSGCFLRHPKTVQMRQDALVRATEAWWTPVEERELNRVEALFIGHLAPFANGAWCAPKLRPVAIKRTIQQGTMFRDCYTEKVTADWSERRAVNELYISQNGGPPSRVMTADDAAASAPTPPIAPGRP